MRWPFVSLARHEETQAFMRGLSDALTVSLNEANERYDALLEKYHALRVSGANAPQAVGLPPAQRPAKPADEAIETVVARFGGNSRLRRQLQKYVYQQRMLGNVDEEQIADNVQHWKDPEDDEESA